MKVLMLGWELPPHNSGGLGIACYQLCKALSKKDIDIEFIVPYRAEHKIDFMSVTAAHPKGAPAVWWAGSIYDRDSIGAQSTDLNIHDRQNLYEKAVERLVAGKEVDIVHAHDWLTFRAALRVKQLKDCPLILHVHSIESDRAGGNPGNPFVREVEEMAMRLADRIIAVSRHTKGRIVADYGVPADKIEVVHNSINPRRLRPLSPENAYNYLTVMKEQGYRVVVNVGRLTIQKGLPNLLRAAREVIERSPKTLFLIVGNGEQYRELIELAAELGIGANVIFADFQRGKRWRDAFAIGDLFVMPSISEPFGLTPLEAIGYGTPSLVSKQSGVSEVLQNCLKVDHWDIKEMANQITNALEQPALREELATNAYKEYQSLSWGAAGDRVLDIYRTHLTGAPS